MKQVPEKKVSVVLCTFNGAAFIDTQIRSILAQTYPLLEIVVADDASTDGTAERLEALAAQNPLIRLYRNPTNLGYNRNFEQALGLALGDVLAIADQDDYWLPHKIATLVEQWQPGSPMIYSNTALFSGPNPKDAHPNKNMRRFAGTDARCLAVYNTVSGHSMLFTKALLQQALPFNPSVYYDWWLAIVAACNGGVQYCPEVLVHQRWHEANASGTHGLPASQHFAAEQEMVLRNLAQFCKTPGMDGGTRHFFETLHGHWQRARQGTGRWPLFSFLMRHRDVVFFSKRRKAPFFSHLKRSYRHAFR